MAYSYNTIALEIIAMNSPCPRAQCVLYSSSDAFMKYDERKFNIQVNVHTIEYPQLWCYTINL